MGMDQRDDLTVFLRNGHEEAPYAGESSVLFNARRMSSFIG